MLNTLRNRLLASYVAILLILLILVGFILLVFLATRPLPTDPVINDLTATLLDVRVVEGFQLNIDPTPSDQQDQPGMGIAGSLLNQAIEQRVTAFLTDAAQTRNVRTLLVANDGYVYFDSAGMLRPGTHVTETERSSLLPSNRIQVVNGLIKGSFLNPDGKEWLYVAQPARRLGPMRPESLLVMVAAPLPRPSLSEVFNNFGDTFFVPLLQAGLIGLVLAIGLAVLIAGSVARPLNRMGQAARRMAGGDYNQRVPVQGPREVRTLAASFNDMAGQVAVTQQAQRDFLANVSHDLRTPLTSIQGFSQAIAEGVTSDPESAQRAALIIHDEAGRMHRMVESLLDLARIEAGQLDFKAHAVGLGDLLQYVGDSLSVKAREKGLQLHIEIPPGLPRIAGDGDRLAQVFTNLLDNAVKHTPSGGQITLRAETDRNGVTVAVQDTGAGIPPDDLPRVFERFYQVDKSRKSDRGSGMGLGLAITRQIVEAHGGIIQVASALGKGTTFTVWLPLPKPDMTTVAGRRPV
jgi:two-component system OmpR family sensor kinase